MIGRYMLLFTVVLFCLSCPVAAVERVKPIEEVQRTTTEVEVVGIRDGTIYGYFTNKSDVPIKDVRLLVRHIWLWDNEYRPGHDTYSVAEYLPIDAVIAPGETIEFSLTPILPSTPGGRFKTRMIVAEFTEVPALTAL